MPQATMTFPADFLWGTATAAHQVEGHNENNDWWAWEQSPDHILNGDRSGAAANWWQRAEIDLDHAAALGTNAHRLSVEWSRIEPEPGAFDNAALDRYRAILGGLRDRGISPMVTLHHFSNPLWFVAKGDFSSEVSVDYFRRYAATVADALGDLVDQWVTINEPLVYVVMRYLEGRFPAPQRRGWSAATHALRTLLRCHAVAYAAIKKRHPSAPVGVAKNIAPIEPRLANSRLDRWWAGRLHWLFNQAWLDMSVDGRLRWPIGRGTIPDLAGSYDFIGLNYYTRFFAHFPPRVDAIVDREWGAEAEVSDGNYGEIYPAGLFEAIKLVLDYDRPIYITENGLPDRYDVRRPAFILRHLREVWRALSFNFPIKGYYHWSLVDNFEWDRGWSQRFGLIELDPATQARTLRPSAFLYRDICRQNAISSEMVTTYAPRAEKILFPA